MQKYIDSLMSNRQPSGRIYTEEEIKMYVQLTLEIDVLYTLPGLVSIGKAEYFYGSPFTTPVMEIGKYCYESVDLSNILITPGTKSAVVPESELDVYFNVYVYGLDEEDTINRIREFTNSVRFVMATQSGDSSIYYNRTTDYIKIRNLRIILKANKDIASILNRIPIGSMAVGYDGDKTYFSESAMIAYTHGYNVFDDRCISKSYISDLRYQCELRGFGLVYPQIRGWDEDTIILPHMRIFAKPPPNSVDFLDLDIKSVVTNGNPFDTYMSIYQTPEKCSFCFAEYFSCMLDKEDVINTIEEFDVLTATVDTNGIREEIVGTAMAFNDCLKKITCVRNNKYPYHGKDKNLADKFPKHFKRKLNPKVVTLLVIGLTDSKSTLSLMGVKELLDISINMLLEDINSY